MFPSCTVGSILTQDFMDQLQEAQSVIQDHKTTAKNLTEAQARVAILEIEMEAIENRKQSHGHDVFAQNTSEDCCLYEFSYLSVFCEILKQIFTPLS